MQQLRVMCGFPCRVRFDALSCSPTRFFLRLLHQLYNAAARDLAQTCPVCVHALDAFDGEYAGMLLSEALASYGNSTLRLLGDASAALRPDGLHDFAPWVNASSLVMRSSGASSTQGALGSIGYG